MVPRPLRKEPARAKAKAEEKARANERIDLSLELRARPSAGRRGNQPPRAPAAAPAAGPVSFGPKSTTSGATAQHGPRFKRMRAGGAWKENGEEGNMAEEVMTSTFAAESATVDQEQALTVETGDGIVDCGATKPVMGEITWMVADYATLGQGGLGEVRADHPDLPVR